MKLIRTTGRNAQAAAETLAALRNRGGAALDAVQPTVKRIVNDVRKRGDRALLGYAAEFDGLSGPDALRVTQEEMADAWKAIDPALRDALTTAADQIRWFAQRQMPASWNESSVEGLTTGQLVRPLGSVGCYVPSGRHPLPSTLLMTAIPAQVAGVSRIVAVSPRPAPETMAAAHLLGITEFYRLGGAHAVAALAYGTASLPRVDKIVGPGSLYVTAAKRLVAFDCAIDMLAGPTEIVVTSERGNAAEIASDLVAQAEHDPEALAIFVTTRDGLAKAVIAETKQRSRENAVAREALKRNGFVFIAGSYEEACDITNWLAPEHLTVDAASDLGWVANAGSVFVGRWSSQPMGDYISGPNHTLPTGGMARVRGGLS
ncbi:MAG: histidinol dehydrogenase, partial [Rudaea sp.]|nr:histidinol dehydrogenase [Rudaea sp.]